MNKRRNIIKNNLIRVFAALVIIVLVNVIGGYLFFRLDLTEEKRYTLSEPTKQILRNLDDIVYFEVYLEGDFPAGFKRLSKATKEMLDQFRSYTDNVQYEFINPSASRDPEVRNDIYRRLVERGLNPTDLQVKTREGASQKIIFPGAIASHKSREEPVELLISQAGVPPEEVLNSSIENLEFNLANTIRKLSVAIKPSIAFIQGHGELDGKETADAFYSLREFYRVERVSINGQLNSLTERKEDSAEMVIRNKYEAIIIAKPDSVFSEKDKFIIDQFVMRGGKVLWLVDPVFASMDSIQDANATVGIVNELNLEDQFFRYGVRMNTDLVMDLNALPIPVRTGSMGGNPQIDFFPWFYFPVLTPLSDHPVVRNLNLIKTEFISSIDTLDIPGIRKEILLTSSPYSRTVNTPVYISLEMLKEEPDERLYSKGPIPVAALLEGEFRSLYQNRIPPALMEDEGIGFLEKSDSTRMIFIADGDVIKNQLRNQAGQVVPYTLGYDRFTEQYFGNKDLILNIMNYLVDESGLINIRSREVKLRLLDNTKIAGAELFWKLFNTIVPVILVIMLGLLLAFLRKRKYSQ